MKSQVFCIVPRCRDHHKVLAVKEDLRKIYRGRYLILIVCLGRLSRSKRL